jgi:hypothetical protein
VASALDVSVKDMAREETRTTVFSAGLQRGVFAEAAGGGGLDPEGRLKIGPESNVHKARRAIQRNSIVAISQKK